MKANELMLGDLYCVTKDVCFKKGTIVVIRGIDADRTFHELKGCATCIALGDSYNMQGGVWLDYLAQIPLTSEILEKNGFVANKHAYPYPYYEYTNEEGKVKVGFAFPQGNRTSYKEPWVYIDSENVFIEHLPCIFVHQLQHALKLCEIDKTIEL